MATCETPWTWLALALLLGASDRASAQAQSTPTSPLARYEAPAGCPAEGELVERIAARTGGEVAPVRLQVAIELADGRAIGRIAYESGELRRSLEASSCGELIEALALVGALMLDPLAAGARPELTGPRRSASPQGRNVTRRATAQPPLTPSHPGSETIEPDAPPADDPASPRALLAAPVIPSAPVASRGRRPALQLSVWLSYLLSTGLTPQPRSAFDGAVELRVGAPRVSLLARAGARRLLPHTSAGDEGNVTFRWWSTVSGLCLERVVQRVAYGACGLLELGSLRAEGSETRNPRSARRLWAAVGPSAQLRGLVRGPLFLQLAAELLLPFAHHRFEVGADTVHSVPWLTFRGELALGIQFW